jgi:hypothetical protein
MTRPAALCADPVGFRARDFPVRLIAIIDLLFRFRVSDSKETVFRPDVPGADRT